MTPMSHGVLCCSHAESYSAYLWINLFGSSAGVGWRSGLSGV